MNMTNKLILKRVAIVTLIFVALVAIVEVIVFNQRGEGSWFLLTLMLFPVELLGYRQPEVYEHQVLLLGLNAAFYAIPFAVVVWMFMLVLTKMRKNE
jgi:hypothetical protein